MQVEYRQLHADEEDTILDMWLETWGGSDREYARNEIRSDPGFVEHTYVAAAPDGAILSTVHYWVHRVRDARGKPRVCGCVSHVATREPARRQGHAQRLMEMTIEAMRREGCEWSLLFSSEMGVSLYKRLGYRLFPSPYRRGLLSGERPPSLGSYSVEKHSPAEAPVNWQAINEVYEVYNANRPLAFVRDPHYWREYVGLKLRGAYFGHSGWVYQASQGGKLCGYLLLWISSEDYARQYYNLDLVFSVGEVGVLSGHEGTIPAMLSAVVDHLGAGSIGGRLFLPYEEPVDSAARVMFTEGLQNIDDRNIMALSLSDIMPDSEIDAVFATPGAVTYLADDF